MDTLEAANEIEAKLKKVSELINKDAQTIAKQAEVIQDQKIQIAHQKKVIRQVRDELIEMKKGILINSAKTSTDVEFRRTLNQYLLNLRSELIEMKRGKGDLTICEEKKEAASVVSDWLDGRIKAGLYLAAGRAIESKRGGKDRLFYDEYSDAFASSHDNSGYNFISLFSDALTQMNMNNNRERVERVTVDYLAMFVAMRTKWIDDSIYYALKLDKERMRNGLTNDGTIKQIVILGCGTCTRAFRLTKLPKDLKMYNVDTAKVIQFRENIFNSDLGICQRVEIATKSVNGRDNFQFLKALCDSGFDPNKKCIWVCEGFLEYHCLDQLQSILKVVSANSCNGSWLIGEMPNMCNCKLKQMHDIWENLGGERVKSGIDLPKQTLDQFGFTFGQSVSILGVKECNYFGRSPDAYVSYQTSTKPVKGDPVTRIQLFRGCKDMKSTDLYDVKTPL